MPAYEANDNCQPRLKNFSGNKPALSAATYANRRAGCICRPKYQNAKLQQVAKPARNKLALKPDTKTKQTINNIDPTTIAKRETNLRYFFAKFVIMESANPDATTTCARPAARKARVNSSGMLLFSPNKKPKASAARSGSVICSRKLFDNPCRILRNKSGGLGLLIDIISGCQRYKS